MPSTPSSKALETSSRFLTPAPQRILISRDISDTLELKIKALEAYESEMREWPHARSIKALEHLARWRGASVGVEAAEAFILNRQLL